MASCASIVDRYAASSGVVLRKLRCVQNANATGEVVARKKARDLPTDRSRVPQERRDRYHIYYCFVLLQPDWRKIAQQAIRSDGRRDLYLPLKAGAVVAV